MYSLTELKARWELFYKWVLSSIDGRVGKKIAIYLSSSSNICFIFFGFLFLFCKSSVVKENIVCYTCTKKPVDIFKYVQNNMLWGTKQDQPTVSTARTEAVSVCNMTNVNLADVIAVEPTTKRLISSCQHNF